MPREILGGWFGGKALDAVADDGSRLVFVESGRAGWWRKPLMDRDLSVSGSDLLAFYRDERALEQNAQDKDESDALLSIEIHTESGL